MIKDKFRSGGKLFPTSFPEVNMVLIELLPGVQKILGNHFTGMYLYGSLAYGGFDQDSDVDFIVVTKDDIPETLFSNLQVMHRRIASHDSWCATQLEGSYVPLCALQHYDPVHVLHLHIDRGKDERLHRMKIDDFNLSRGWWGGWVLLRAVLWENGIILAGLDPRTFIEPVTAQELKQAVLAILEGWAKPLLEKPSEIAYSGYQSYCVLTLCRILYTREHGAIVSKQMASRWAQKTLGEPWFSLIERTWAGRHRPQIKASEADVKGTLDFIRYTLDRTQ